MEGANPLAPRRQGIAALQIGGTKRKEKSMRRSLGIGMLLLTSLAPARAETSPLLHSATRAELKSTFLPLGADWTATDKGLEGRSPHYSDLPATQVPGFADDAHTYFVVHGTNLWRFATAGDSKWSDYSIETTVQILDPAPLKGVRPGQDQVFMNYQWGREAMGSDAGIAVRYQGPDQYYLVRLSTGYGHIELWKTKGGIVAVKPFQFQPRKDYRVKITASGRWITVAVDGQEVLRYADPVEPLLTGKIALGVRESRVRFADLTVTAVPATDEPVPVHKPDFHFRDWVGRHYIFDGDEPVGHITKNGCIQEMKLVPGLMPLLVEGPGATWGDLRWKEQAALRTDKEGTTLAFHLDLDDQDGRCTGTGDWTLSYDPARGYVWDLRATVTVLVDGKVQKWNVNIADPCFYQTVAPSTTKLPACRTAPNFALYTRADGRYGWFPANHQFKNGNADFRELQMKRGGFFATTVDDWAVVVEVPEDNAYQYGGDYCAWGLDQHVYPIIDPSMPGGDLKPDMLTKKGDVFTGHARFYAFPPARVQQIIKEGVCAPANASTPKELVAHVEPVNHCDDIVAAVAGDSKSRWIGDYAIDRSVGRGDHVAMRIIPPAGKQAAVTLDQIGPSFRSGPYPATKYRIGCWVKADAFTGSVRFQVDRAAFPAKHDFKDLKADCNITGKCDWTWVGFETDFPRFAHLWVQHLYVTGTGTVWVDDFEVSPVE